MAKVPIIETVNLTKRFKRVIAVNDLNLRIEEGDAFGFLGPNGAGKTTTIKMMTGFLRPTSGTVRVMGRDMFKDPKEAKSRFGLIPDHFGFYDDLTAVDHLQYYGALYGIPKGERDDRIAEVLEMVGLVERCETRTKEFSHGMQQRLVIAQALLNRPKLLFLDEPTTGLDPRGSHEVKEIIKGLVKKGMTIFISSHLLWEVQELCTKIGIIDRGHLLRMDTIGNLGEELSRRSGILVHMDIVEAPAEAVKALKALKGVISIEVGPNYLRAKVEDHTVSPDIPAVFIKEGGRFRSCYELVPNLEQIFLELTGGGQPQRDASYWASEYLDGGKGKTGAGAGTGAGAEAGPPKEAAKPGAGGGGG